MSFLEPDVVSTEICNFEIVVILNVFVNSPIGYVLLSLTFLLKIPFSVNPARMDAIMNPCLFYQAMS